MTKTKSGEISREHALIVAISIAEAARLDRPEKPYNGVRRRCGDVIRWKANNAAIDQIVSDLRRTLTIPAKPSKAKRRK